MWFLSQEDQDKPPPSSSRQKVNDAAANVALNENLVNTVERKFYYNCDTAYASARASPTPSSRFFTSNSIAQLSFPASSSNQSLNVRQLLHETLLSFDVPIYLLTLWETYFKDASQLLDEYTSTIKYDENEQLLHQMPEMVDVKAFNETSYRLKKKLKDYEAIFNYYLSSTKNFAKQSEKFKKSPLKDVENIKFLPLNLHLEQLIISDEKSQSSQPQSSTTANSSASSLYVYAYDQPTANYPSSTSLVSRDSAANISSNKKCYHFTSVGVFTTAHTTKASIVPVEYLINRDPPFRFGEERLQHDTVEMVENDVLLVFFSLKVLIALINDVKVCRQQLLVLNNTNKENKSMIFEPLKERLRELVKSVIASFKRLLEANVATARIELKQSFYNALDRFEFFDSKFRSIGIELNNLIRTSASFERINVLLNGLISSTVELYDVIFNEVFKEKFEFIDSCAIFCQSLTTFIASVDLMLNKRNKHMSAQERDELVQFYEKYGALFQVESLLSCMANENLMIQDHFKAIQSLNYVYLHLDEDNNQDSTFHVDIQRDGFHVYMSSGGSAGSSSKQQHQQKQLDLLVFENTGDTAAAATSLAAASSDKKNKPIKIYPIMINVGINEQAVASSFFGQDLLQKFINTQSIVKLQHYYNNAKNNPSIANNQKLSRLYKTLATNRSLIVDSRPIELLSIVSEITRHLYGIRVTNCKSGKDRTGMSVSLEQCNIMIQNHNLPEIMTQQVLDDLRRNGTRLDVVKKNVSTGKYAFNKFRFYLLSPLYRPPYDCCADLET